MLTEVFVFVYVNICVFGFMRRVLRLCFYLTIGTLQGMFYFIEYFRFTLSRLCGRFMIRGRVFRVQELSWGLFFRRRMLLVGASMILLQISRGFYCDFFMGVYQRFIQNFIFYGFCRQYLGFQWVLSFSWQYSLDCCRVLEECFFVLGFFRFWSSCVIQETCWGGSFKRRCVVFSF